MKRFALRVRAASTKARFARLGGPIVRSAGLSSAASTDTFGTCCSASRASAPSSQSVASVAISCSSS